MITLSRRTLALLAVPFLMLAILAIFAGSDGRANRLSPSPGELVSSQSPCTPEHDHDCYVIDRSGEIYGM